MSLTIAICDDNENQIKELRRILGEWAADKPFALEIEEYISAESFLFSYFDRSCDLLLLDIEMGQLNGMELAKKLRAGGDMLPIVFITGYSDYMNDGYEVEALHYLLKPVDKEKLFAVLERYIRRSAPKKELTLRCEEKTLHISPDNICLMEAMGKRTIISLADGRRLECLEGISEIKGKLSKEFMSCHRSYTVNLRFVRSIGKTEVELDDGVVVPLSRRMYKEVNEAFIQFYTKE